MTRGVALAFAGGCAGGALRLAIVALWPSGDGIPWALLAVNLSGSFVIGLIGVLWGGHRHWWPLLGPGFLGGFTTFSAIAAATWSTQSGAVTSIAVLVASVVVCTIAARLGVSLGERAREGRP